MIQEYMDLDDLPQERRARIQLWALRNELQSYDPDTDTSCSMRADDPDIDLDTI
jgi:hypothetical protein